MDLTRLSHNHGIGCLSGEDRADFAGRFLSGFGLASGKDPERIGRNIGKILDTTEGWPRHMHHSFQAIGEHALLAGGDLSRLDWKSVASAARERRRAYYRRQRSPQMEDSRSLTGIVLRDLRDGMRSADIDDIIERNAEDRPGWRLPDGMNSGMFRRHLIHKGALQRHPDDTYHCPIPSFHEFLVSEGGPEVKARPKPPPFVPTADGDWMPPDFK